MARKSNKTAHVLNLIAGHEAPADGTEETLSAKEASSAASSPKKTAPASAAPTQSISVIDTTEEDPVADLIQQNLTDKFEGGESKSPAEVSVTTQPSENQTGGETTAPTQTQSTETAEPAPTQTQSTETAEPASTQASSTETVEPAPTQALNNDSSASTSTPSVNETSEPAPAQTQSMDTAKDSPAEEITETEESKEENEEKEEIIRTSPEPDFVRVNVIEEVVKDKIIYFMRQFDVCTCERCIQDTIALTLNGILPKYIVTTPAAVAPLMSFYTNRYITDVTVEATKACMVVKENPRH